ncbi:migration and invasion-inhibitory protein [Amblyraja radiata]|uniref:migration and invasion-inhibitory protein n=1 Tax=Amblyraja radiata TaxID=386614 RepID=UPI0014021560|nr:migration and invasion-inhibitory protein [Amblyraja radiata]XP_032904124.1 migration and invasion-inhibitory protein [Amblyraja radiata]XP_032904125.1 migration and invasion-inhibitory protein [Amblyraja radiata]XP_032904126.1 migration and invasion-inhibitory protein [Amblyraja radiata]XP_032904127.1 migration and invasion-inhibitory protein [Amblyraja radiata]
MSYSDCLQSLRHQNKHLLQRLREERQQFGAPSSTLQPPESRNGVNSAEIGKAADSQENSYRANRLEGDGCLRKNPSLKYKTSCELLGQQTKNDVFQQPTEVVISESLQKREESRAALCTPSMHRPTKQGWGLGSGDGAGMELADRLPIDKAKAVSSVDKNSSTSAIMSPGESFVTAVPLGQKWNTQKLDPKSNHMTEYFQSSTPFTKPPNPMLTNQPELPIPTSSTTGADCKRSSSQHYSHFLQSLNENPNPRSKLDSPLYVDLLLDAGNDRHGKHFIRNTQKPKSILLEPHNKMVKADIGHVTFLSPDEESSFSTKVQSVQPLLGYDWIAGLIDVDSRLSEKSEQYFLELQNFRRVNKEECIHQEYMEDGEQNDKVTDQEELDYKSQSHQCTHSYRVNSRLFAVPLEPAAACAVCKTPKSKRPHTMEEPAYIRVSIPRSTLLPPHTYKPHRRKSFNPTDSLSLPSHCLLGWENSMPSTTPVASTLDLHSALEDKKTSVPLSPNRSNMSAAAVSRVAGGTRTDELLDFSRSTRYQFQKLEQSLKLR